MSSYENGDTDREYDVALSFAGEERAYVAQVASALATAGVRVFFDEYEIATLWGKDLFAHLSHVYRQGARYTVIFVSTAYSKKLWPDLERRSAQSRALEQRHEYILPARFDDTEIPGLLPTTQYVDLRRTSPQQLANLIIAKLGYAPKAMSSEGINTDTALDLLVAVQSGTSSLTESITRTLRFATASRFPDLERFCINELVGYSGEQADDSDGAASYRSVRFFCSPVELDELGMSVRGLTVRAAISLQKELFIERRIFVPEPISFIEARLSKAGSGRALHLRLPVSVFTKEFDDPNTTIHCYAEIEAYSDLLQSIKQELTRRLASRLGQRAF